MWLSIGKGKTAAAVRRVPVVDATVRKMLLARAAKGKERLFHELEPDRFGDYGSALGSVWGASCEQLG